MSHLNPDNKNTTCRYKFVLFLFLAQIVFANMTMAQNQRIIVGVLENWPPQYMIDPKTKKPTGFAVDIIREIARLSGLDISYEVFKEWPVLNQALREKKIDVIPNMGIIEERENLFKYTIPVETTKISFFVRKTSNDIDSEKDLTGRAISVVETNKGRFLMEERRWGNLKIYQSFDEALMSVVSGISDGIVYPDPPFMNILQQYGLGDRIKVVGEPLLEIKRAIAVHSDHSDLVNKLNDAVKVLVASAKYKEIYSRWYGKPTPFWSVKLVAVIMGISISIIGLALLAWRYYSVMKLNKSLLVQTQKRNMAEKALHESREDLMESQRIALLGSWRLDIKSNQVVWSEELYKMYGFDPATPPPPYTEHQKLFTPESWDRLSAALNNTRDKGIPYELELETVRKDGSHGWMWVYGQTIRDTKGEIVGLRGAAQDITDRKKAEEALRASQESYSTLFHEMQNGFAHNEIICNAQGLPINSRYLAVNPAFERITGKKAEDVVGKTILDVFPALEPSWIEMFGRVALTGESTHFEGRASELGITFDVSAFCPAPNQYACTFTDITERKKAEEALRVSEATIRKKLKAIVEPEGDISTLELSDIMDIDIMQSMMEEFYRATGMLGAVLDLSGKVLVAFGWQDICTKFHRCHPETLKNCVESDTALTRGVPPGTVKAYRCKNNMWDMVTPLMVGDRHIGNVFFGQFFYEGETPDVELFRVQARQYGFNETEYLAALTRVPHFSQEAAEAGLLFCAQLAGIVTTLSYNAIKQARMLAERERLREELITLNTELEVKVEQRTAALEASNKELEAFSYSVSHDLRAPLRHISGYVELLNNRFREALPEKAGHYLHEITDSSRQMGDLIDDLLQFSRTGRQELRQADMDMSAVVQEALEKLKAATQDRNISWTVTDLPRVFGDSSLLAQVWINLLDNAVKYTRYKDEAKIEVGCTRAEDQWEFYVRDNGVGFDMRYAHKLFGVFQRLHSPAQFAGTGIGLANVQRIVHKHGGRVRAEGTPGESASFYFTIPEKPLDEGGKSWSN